jgi:Protein of unknown function (DUF1569)
MDSPLERLRHELEQLLSKLTEATQFEAPKGKWTSAQILEHLLLTYKNTSRGARKCLEQGVPLATTRSVRQLVGALVVVKLGYMPGGTEAPQRAVPQGVPLEQVCATILPELENMAAALDGCEKRFGLSTKIMDHPFLGPLTPGQWRKFHWVHGRHHLRQVRDRARI